MISKLQKLREKKYEYEQSKLSTDQSIQKLEEVKTKYHLQEEKIRLLAKEMEQEKGKFSSLL